MILTLYQRKTFNYEIINFYVACTAGSHIHVHTEKTYEHTGSFNIACRLLHCLAQQALFQSIVLIQRSVEINFLHSVTKHLATHQLKSILFILGLRQDSLSLQRKHNGIQMHVEGYVTGTLFLHSPHSSVKQEAETGQAVESGCNLKVCPWSSPEGSTSRFFYSLRNQQQQLVTNCETYVIVVDIFCSNRIRALWGKSFKNNHSNLSYNSTLFSLLLHCCLSTYLVVLFISLQFTAVKL